MVRPNRDRLRGIVQVDETYVEFARVKNRMSEPRAGQVVISRPIVSLDNAFLLNDTFDKRYQAITGCILQMSQSKSSHYFMAFFLRYFYSNTNQSFSSSTATSFSGFCSAYIVPERKYKILRERATFISDIPIIEIGTSHASTVCRLPPNEVAYFPCI
ncbi:conserved hypothetical protein [delta proteobacterium NaphS2]|nr:conserved hypothetical protein [delta proteobacterium NaphS2]